MLFSSKILPTTKLSLSSRSGVFIIRNKKTIHHKRPSEGQTSLSVTVALVKSVFVSRASIYSPLAWVKPSKLTFYGVSYCEAG